MFLVCFTKKFREFLGFASFFKIPSLDFECHFICWQICAVSTVSTDPGRLINKNRWNKQPGDSVFRKRQRNFNWNWSDFLFKSINFNILMLCLILLYMQKQRIINSCFVNNKKIDVLQMQIVCFRFDSQISKILRQADRREGFLQSKLGYIQVLIKMIKNNSSFRSAQILKLTLDLPKIHCRPCKSSRKYTPNSPNLLLPDRSFSLKSKVLLGHCSFIYISFKLIWKEITFSFNFQGKYK